MNFLTPLAFTLAVLLPVIVAFYFLKLRRQEQVISSVYLWQELVRDVAANAPWQRLRFNWLLLLQLLFLSALIVALARPFSWTTAAAGGHLILVLDTSASMAATDVTPDRLVAATVQARRLAAALPPDTPVTLIAAGMQAQVLLSGSTDRLRLAQVLDGLRAGPGGSDMATALELAAAVAAGEPDAEIVVLSDGGVELPAHLSAAGRIRYLPIGRSGENQAISALSLDHDVSGRGFSAFVRVTNYGQQGVTRRLTLYAFSSPAQREGSVLTARDLFLPAGESVGFTVPDLPPETIAIEARLGGEDVLSLDDRAWAVAPLVYGAQVQIVGPGNRFLETAFSLLPGVEVTTISLEDYEATWSDEPVSLPSEHLNWLTVFDTVLPQEGHYPPGALFFVGPLRSTEFFSVTGVLDLPAARPVSAGDPLLRYVDLSGLVIQRAARIPLPDWARPVVVASSAADQDEGDMPLLAVGQRDGRRLAVLAFDLRQSDLPLRVAFPVLLAHLVDYLAPGIRGAFPETVVPGAVVEIPLPPQASAALVTYPDGTRADLTVRAGAALFEDTQMPGIYEVTWKGEGERWLLGRFAVNGFNALEADIAPRQTLAIVGAGAVSYTHL
ncbi:MAG: BatA and WFA domain-containing protein, partial [Anaerolineae bacterium]|nr:BatA and WFA domain-containing protein [Anaerolineae bacterium]